MTGPAKRKVAVVGTGAVGSSIAYALLISGLVNELLLVDIDRAKAEGEAMDLAHGAPFVQPIRVYAGEYMDCHDADVIIFSAGANQKPGETRLELINKNFQVLKNSLPRLMTDKCKAILLMVSNPVDVLTYAALKLTGCPPERVIGSGTVLDSSRFRHLLACHCRVDARNIHAYIVGEHGDSEVPLWSLANIAGVKIDEFCSLRGMPPVNKEEITEKVRRAAYEIISRKGATYYAIGLVVKRICESILRNEHSILTVSGLVNGFYGIDGCCLSLPAVISRDGREKVIAPPLPVEEVDALRKSAEILKSIQGEALTDLY